jgi:hypothetical protein
MGKNRNRTALSSTDRNERSGPALVLDHDLYDRSGNPARRNAVVDGCRRALEKILARPGSGLGFHAQSLAGGAVAYHLSGPDAIPADAGDRPYKVFPLDDAPRFWVTCTLRFRSERLKARLVEVSLVFFQGGITTPKQPILRAEWDCISYFGDADHAQPHWHVYQSPATQIDWGIDGQAETNTVQTLDAKPGPHPERDRTDVGGSNFHLAMAARWDEGGPHRIPLTVDGVAEWVEGCVTYTRGQLTQS